MGKASRQKKPKQAEPTIAEALDIADKLLKDFERLGYVLTDTKDWERIPEQERAERKAQVGKFYKSTHFNIFSVRDEVMIALAAAYPSKINKVGKVVNVQKLPPTKTAAKSKSAKPAKRKAKRTAH